ncbi:MAG: hypothetical protein ACRDN9_02720 [Streptosporangiaceae bacterium]
MNLSFLAPLYDRPGPYASVYLDTSRTVEDASHQMELRWRAVRGGLAEQRRR